MKTYCPYPDCSAVYQVEASDKSSIFNGVCPKCGRLGRIKALEIIDKLKDREEKLNQLRNQENQDNQEGYQELALNPLSGFQALLEDIRSLWNVGSMFRTADAIGISKLHLCGITGCPPRREISKTALGAEQDIPWTYYHQPLTAINMLKNNGVTILGLERNSESISLTELLKKQKIKTPFCLAVGNEVAGLSPELMQSCDYLCDLPMKGKKESLNVASAFAVAAYFINEFTY